MMAVAFDETTPPLTFERFPATSPNSRQPEPNDMETSKTSAPSTGQHTDNQCAPCERRKIQWLMFLPDLVEVGALSAILALMISHGS